MTSSTQNIPEILSASLLTALDVQPHEGDEGAAEALAMVESLLRDALSHARATWRGVELQDGAFIDALMPIVKAQMAANKAQQPGVLVIHETLSSLHIVDLYLAIATLAHVPLAIATFQKRYAPELHSICARFDSHKIGRDDLIQSLHELLFVGHPPERPPKLARYTGTGPLYSWLRVTASRHFIDLTRSRAHSPQETPLADELLAMVVDHGDNLEVTFLKNTYRAQFKEAVSQAVHTLDAEQRVLLRQSFIERQSIDALSLIHGVHRATVARRIQRARDDLFTHAQRHMMQHLKLEDDGDFTSIFNLIQSRLDVSIQRLLSEPASP